MLQVYDVTSGDKQTLRVSPLFFDVDHDGLLDVLVPVYGISEGEGQCQTVVIGWAGPPAQADISGPATGRAALHQSRPNPTSGGMSIEFSMPTEGNVQLRIFDVAGRVVRRLVDEHLAAGEYTIPWNGRHDDGTPAGTGNYYYQLRVDGEEQARRALLMR